MQILQHSGDSGRCIAIDGDDDCSVAQVAWKRRAGLEIKLALEPRFKENVPVQLATPSLHQCNTSPHGGIQSFQMPLCVQHRLCSVKNVHSSCAMKMCCVTRCDIKMHRVVVVISQRRLPNFSSLWHRVKCRFVGNYSNVFVQTYVALSVVIRLQKR